MLNCPKTTLYCVCRRLKAVTLSKHKEGGGYIWSPARPRGTPRAHPPSPAGQWWGKKPRVTQAGNFMGQVDEASDRTAAVHAAIDHPPNHTPRLIPMSPCSPGRCDENARERSIACLEIAPAGQSECWPIRILGAHCSVNGLVDLAAAGCVGWLQGRCCFGLSERSKAGQWRVRARTRHDTWHGGVGIGNLEGPARKPEPWFKRGI